MKCEDASLVYILYTYHIILSFHCSSRGADHPSPCIMPFYVLLEDDPEYQYGPFRTKEQASFVAEAEGHTRYQIGFLPGPDDEPSYTEPVATSHR